MAAANIINRLFYPGGGRIELVERTIPYTRRDVPLTFTAVGDLHVGNAGFDRDYFLKQRKDIIDRNAYTVLVGDLMDMILMSDKRHDAAMIDERYIGDLDDMVGDCLDDVIALFEPMKHLILGVVEGNHEEAFRRRAQLNVTKRIADALGVPDLKGGAYIRTVLKRGRSRNKRGIFATHGAGGATTYGSKMNRLIALRDVIDADIYMQGHVHDLLVKIIPRLECFKYSDRLGLSNHPMAFMCTGSYLQTYKEGASGYGERRTYKPVTMGCGYIDVYPEDNEMRVSL